MKDAERSVERAVRSLVRLSRLLERADAGVSLAQFRILELVARGTQRSTQIASRLATSKPAVTAVVDSLVAAGLLRRGGETGDRRVVRLALTPKGRRALARAEQAYADRLAPLLEQVSDRHALLRQLIEIDQAMDARWGERTVTRPAATPVAAPAAPAAATSAATASAPTTTARAALAAATPGTAPTTTATPTTTSPSAPEVPTTR